MDTLLLNRANWDLCIDARGNIAMATDNYAIIQDVASRVRLVTGELYYGPADDGVPYFTDGLGVYYPTQLLKSRIVAAALQVPGVTGAAVFLNSVVDRAITGQVQVQTAGGPLVITL